MTVTSSFLVVKSRRIEAATVRLPKLGGQGVLVPGGFVLTATHTIEWSNEGGSMATMGDHFLEPVETKSGARFRMSPLSVDPVSDLAVLGEPDNQVFFDDAQAFQEWRDATPGVPLSGAFADWCEMTRDGEKQEFQVHVLAHSGEWIDGRATRTYWPRNDVIGQLWISMSRPIKGGTSGGPVVDDAGRLVGVVSWASEVDDAAPCDGSIPIAAHALPHWILVSILTGTAAQ